MFVDVLFAILPMSPIAIAILVAAWLHRPQYVREVHYDSCQHRLASFYAAEQLNADDFPLQ